MTSYAIIIEAAGKGFSGYVPDLPGCVATGRTVDEVEAELRVAIPEHLESLRTHGEPIPAPRTASVRTVEVA